MGETERGLDAVSALSWRLDQAVSTWRARLREEAGGRSDAKAAARPAPAEIEAARAALQQQLAEVVDEAAGIREGARHEHDAAADWEARAMAAIQRGDDGAAMRALKEHGHHFAAAAALDDELRILDAMAETCRQALAEGGGARPA